MAELEDIPEEHWHYRPGPGARTLQEVAHHIVEAGLGFTAELLRPDGSFQRFMDPQVRAQLMAAYPKAESRREMIDLLRSTGEQNAQRLRAVGEALATQSMQTSAGEESRLKGLWFTVGHEMYHFGQLATYARAVGRIPVMTQRSEAMRASSRQK